MGKASFKVGATIIVVFLLLQLVPVEHSNPPVAAEVSAPEPVMEVLRTSCYDCHSNETVWPWYSRVAPVSWLISKHVEIGRDHVNFSEWGALPLEDRIDAREEIWEEVESGVMPHRGYLRWNPEARLSEAKRGILEEWANSVEPLVPDTAGTE
jgi:hypothetical protein